MYFPVLANVASFEGLLSGTPVTITFPWRSRKTTIINDSTTNSMVVTINGQDLTLKTGESMITSVRLGTFTINGTGLYRIWGMG